MSESCAAKWKCPSPMRKSYITTITVEISERIGIYLPVHEERVPYFGPWEELKGDSVAKQEEQAQAEFTQTLMGIFQQQYQNQSAVLSYLKGKMQPIIDQGGIGYDTATLNSMRTSASDTNAQQFQNAQRALQNRISAGSGGSKLVGVSGAATQDIAALEAAGATQEAATQNEITQANANLKQQNYWDAINVLNGTAAQYNPLGYTSAVTGGSNAVSGLSQAVTASQQSGLMGALGGVIGGIASGGTGSIGGAIASHL